MMPNPKILLAHANRALADLRPRDSATDLNLGSEIGSIIGGVFGVLAVLVAVMFGIRQIKRWNKEDEMRQKEEQRRQAEERRRANKLHKRFGRWLMFWQ